MYVKKRVLPIYNQDNKTLTNAYTQGIDNIAFNQTLHQLQKD